MVLGGVANPAVPQNRLQTLVELRLRSAGIRVFDALEDDAKDLRQWMDCGGPCLSVTVAGPALDSPEGKPIAMALHVEVELLQAVRMDRDPKLVFQGGTWSDGITALIPSPTATRIEEDVTKLVDRFANVFLKANPK